MIYDSRVTNFHDETCIVVFPYSGSTIFFFFCASGRHLDDGSPAPTEGKIMSVQAAGGIIAGATASCVTTPLDTIKTRLQVSFLCYNLFAVKIYP